MPDYGKPKAQRSTTSSKNRHENSPPPYRSHPETSMEDFVNEFWQHAMNVAEHHEDDFKHQALPLARIKKVAKMDPEVQNQMISSEVTVLFEKACQIFIQELTARAHLVSLGARRRTLSRADVAQAVSRSDMFDFLIDIVPRTEQRAAASTSAAGPSGSGAPAGGTKRPARSRKASQRNSPAAAAPEYPAATGAEDAEDGEDEEEEDEDGEPSGKRFRLDDGQQQQQQQSAFAALDPAQAAAAAAAAAAAGYYLPQAMPDGAAFAPGQLPWGPPFDYPTAPADAGLHAYYQPPGASGSGTNGAGHGDGQAE